MMLGFCWAGLSGSSQVHTPGSSLMRHPDRGTGFYHQKRERYGRASLLETGRSDTSPRPESATSQADISYYIPEI
jgi:hypothetical protein